MRLCLFHLPSCRDVQSLKTAFSSQKERPDFSPHLDGQQRKNFMEVLISLSVLQWKEEIPYPLRSIFRFKNLQRIKVPL